RHVTSSSLSLDYEEGKRRQPFYCRARHAQGERSAIVSNPGSPSTPTPISLHPPSRDDFEGPYRNSSLLCRASGAARALRWFRNGLDVTSDAITQSLSLLPAPGAAMTGGGTFTESRLVVTEAEWDAGTQFSCQLETEARNASKASECG
ncbi:IGHM protein, partial [Atlantisia rogersi]|nr:IGHM protein [Atlantisia rogersi]